jgi:hypothetical protein
MKRRIGVEFGSEFSSDQLLRLNCSFNVLETSAVTLGLKREPNSALVLSGFLMTGSDQELRAPMQGSLRYINFLVTGSSAGGVLVAASFLYVTDLKPS